MFEALGNKLQDILDNLSRSSKLTEPQVKAAMREIRMALLEADVNFGVAKDFVARVGEKAVGQDVLGSLQPGQQVVKVVHEELIETLGGKSQLPTLRNEGNVWFMVGLQGAGKTTSSGKLAAYYKGKGRRVLLVAADTQRPAAREQLRTLGQQVGVPVLEVADHEAPETTRARIAEHLQKDYRDLVIVDTAGRLQIDERLMDQLADLKGALEPTETLLVVDAMTGQEALGVARTFEERIGLSGLIERAEQAEISTTMPKKPGDFDLEDLLNQLRQIRKMGPLGDLLKMIPGMSRMLPAEFNVDEKQIQKIDAMISSMTLKERHAPKIIDGKRRKRIASGSGVTVQEVNKLLKMHEQMKEMMKVLQKMGMGGMAGGKGGKMPKMPFGPGGPRP